ncbi:MAG: hypothetical protein M5U01_17310 [Ardenticatenaceae bacterium]|nr:hypothetical protein [Ardenticatenaceae bacterium]
MTAPDHLPALVARLLRDLAARPLPPRRLRSNPRVVKRKMSTIKLKRPHHDRWPNLRRAPSAIPWRLFERYWF